MSEPTDAKESPAGDPPATDDAAAGGAPAADRDAATSVAAAVHELDLITRRLRRECPWDREQDERSIVPHTVEEAYELADAAMRGDHPALLDELGDVLFQVHFLSLLLEERGVGDMATVAENCRQKLVRRHPHVFGGAAADSAGEVLKNWDRIKREVEGRGSDGLFSDVPENLPALLYARKAQRRAASARGEQAPPADRARREADEREIGAALFELVDRARRLRVDPELALRAETHRFMEDFEPHAYSRELPQPDGPPDRSGGAEAAPESN